MSCALWFNKTLSIKTNLPRSQFDDFWYCLFLFSCMECLLLLLCSHGDLRTSKSWKDSNMEWKEYWWASEVIEWNGTSAWERIGPSQLGFGQRLYTIGSLAISQSSLPLTNSPMLKYTHFTESCIWCCAEIFWLLTREVCYGLWSLAN